MLLAIIMGYAILTHLCIRMYIGLHVNKLVIIVISSSKMSCMFVCCSYICNFTLLKIENPDGLVSMAIIMHNMYTR